MNIRVLGSAAGGGFPQWNCNCPNCAGWRNGTLKAVARTQSSIAISSDHTRWALFNTSPDILQQIRECPALQPARQLRDTGIQAVILMDAQIDHTTGLYMLRENRGALPVWCTDLVKGDLSTGNPILGVLAHYCGVQWHNMPLGSAFTIDGLDHLQFTALPLLSNAPPYSSHRDNPQAGDNVGMSVTNTQNGRTVFYAPALGQMEPHIWAAMQAADCVMVDGTLWTEDEMITLGASQKTSRAMGHMPQSGADGMLAWLAKLPTNTRKILIHINNTNPILNEDGAERAELTRLGIEVAFDGMEINL
jgi:pyrroloquinoline quinone biosynthesis protein B